VHLHGIAQERALPNLENETGETLVAVIVLAFSVDASRFLEPRLAAKTSLEACRVELHKLAGQ
jgi:hypothetical protein